jgi:hypothetical protein
VSGCRRTGGWGAGGSRITGRRGRSIRRAGCAVGRSGEGRGAGGARAVHGAGDPRRARVRADAGGGAGVLGERRVRGVAAAGGPFTRRRWRWCTGAGRAGTGRWRAEGALRAGCRCERAERGGVKILFQFSCKSEKVFSLWVGRSSRLLCAECARRRATSLGVYEDMKILFHFLANYEKVFSWPGSRPGFCPLLTEC